MEKPTNKQKWVGNGTRYPRARKALHSEMAYGMRREHIMLRGFIDLFQSPSIIPLFFFQSKPQQLPFEPRGGNMLETS
jgi:hypothetical protein